MWGIRTDPEGYEKYTWNIYAAKSKPLGGIPPFTILFGIEPKDDVVVLMWIEDMGGIGQIADFWK